MTTSIKATADGLSAIIQVGGADKVTIGANGIEAGSLAPQSVTAGSYAPQSITPNDLSQKLTLGTAVASTSGTAIDFTGIPSWARRVTVMFNGVSTNGTNHLLIQVGAGSIQAVGYVANGSALSPAVNTTNGTASTAGFPVFNSNAASVWYGSAILTLVGANAWTAVSSFTTLAGNNIQSTGSGGVTLSGTLDRIRITTVSGTDTFDAGSINLIYE